MLLFSALEGNSARYREVSVDEQLIWRMGQDDAEAFRQFYEATSVAVYAYLLSLTQNPHDAEDLMQETYLKIRAAAGVYVPQGKPMAWVFTIAKNLNRMRLRQQERICTSSSQALQERSAFAVCEIDAEDRIILSTLLDALPETERSIILLHLVSGYKHREIAKDMGLPLSTVLSKYHRGLKKLKSALDGKEGV